MPQTTAVIACTRFQTISSRVGSAHLVVAPKKTVSRYFPGAFPNPQSTNRLSIVPIESLMIPQSFRAYTLSRSEKWQHSLNNSCCPVSVARTGPTARAGPAAHTGAYLVSNCLSGISVPCPLPRSPVTHCKGGNKRKALVSSTKPKGKWSEVIRGAAAGHPRRALCFSQTGVHFSIDAEAPRRANCQVCFVPKVKDPL
jgi:hypothetical protein